MARHGVLILALLAATAVPAAAQDRLTVFLHGFNSGPDSWGNTASRLAVRLQIIKYVPTLPWHLPYDTQATHLNHEANAAGAPPNTVVVGHSNGGLVARQLSTKRALGGIVTLGSPHRGAPLAANIRGVAQRYLAMGDKLNALLFMLGAGTSTNQFTGTWFSPGLAPVRASVATLGAVLWNAFANIQQSIGPVVTAPVLADMTPGSAILGALNGPGNLARESASIPRRVGLVYAAREWWIGAPFVAGAPHLQYWGHEGVKGGIAVLSLIEGYFGYPNFMPYDPVALTIRNQIRSLVTDLLSFNAIWCSATSGRADCSISTDGVVPTESQYFPGDAANVGYYGPAHVTQKQLSENALYDALTTRIGLQPRTINTAPTGNGMPGSTIAPGQRLYPDTEVRSPNGAYRLRYQSDGNLVLYGPAGAVWSSGTAGLGGLFAEMQPDGNFVVYNATGADPWESGTAGIPGAELRVQDDGYIVIYDAGGNVPWYEPR